MKFGKRLADRQVEWGAGAAEFFVNYKELKRIINGLDSDHAAEADRAESHSAIRTAFFYRFERELEKASGYFVDSAGALRARLAALEGKLRVAQQRGGCGRLRALAELATDLQRDVHRLHAFVELNGTALRKILKKWDKRSKSETQEVYLTQLVAVAPMFQAGELAALSDSVDELVAQSAAAAADDASLGYAVSDAADVEDGLARVLASRDEVAVRRFLAGEGAQMADSGSIGRVLRRSCGRTSLACVRVLLDAAKGVPFDAPGAVSERTCVHAAAEAGDAEMVDLFISRGAAAAPVDASGRSPLHCAASGGHLDVVNVLLAHLGDAAGAAAALQADSDGCSPFLYAVGGGHLAIVERLLRFCASNISSSPRPLALACQRGHAAVVDLLLRIAGASIAADAGGLHPLHIAAARPDGSSVLELLLAHTSERDPRDPTSGWTPLIYAAACGNEACVAVLVAAGANLATVDLRGWTAASHAAYRGHLGLLRILRAGDGSAGALRPALDVGGSPPIPIDRTPAPSGPVDARALLAHTPDRLVLADDVHSEPVPPTALAVPPSRSAASSGAVSPLNIDSGAVDSAAPLADPSQALSQVSSQVSSEMTTRTAQLAAGPTTAEIPSLALPPPLVPFRIYGHHFVDGRVLVSLTLGPTSLQLDGREKDVANARVLAAPLGEMAAGVGVQRALVLPVATAAARASGGAYEEQTLEYLVDSLDSFRLQLDIMPLFGTRILAQTALLGPALRRGDDGARPLVLPLFDAHQRCVGHLEARASIVTPFMHPRLEIGGAVDTYWKSTRVVRDGARRRALLSATSLGPPSSAFRTLLVRVPSGNVPVGQFDGSSERPLAQLLESLPDSNDVHIRLLLGAVGDCTTDEAVDAVLQVVYDTTVRRRRIIFSSSVPDACFRLNWKQPNFAVLLDASDCSLRSAVHFARRCSLLGVLCPASLLLAAPELSTAVRDAGLLFAVSGDIPGLSCDAVSVDGHFHCRL